MAFWRGELLKVIAQVKAVIPLSAIHDAAESTTPVDADEFALADSADSFVVKKITWANLKVALGSLWATVTHAATSKTTPVNADEFSIVDSAASNVIKRLTWANLKAALYAPGGTDVAVADGGTGRSSHTIYAVICGGTTTTAAQQSIASVGASGDVLMSNGAGALPTFQAVAAIDYGAGNAALAYGAIGTYVLASKTATTGFAANSTYAGSTLKPAGFGADNPSLAPDTAASGVEVAYGGSALAGTWRAMGHVNYTPASGNDLFATLFLRIS